METGTDLMFEQFKIYSLPTLNAAILPYTSCPHPLQKQVRSKGIVCRKLHSIENRQMSLLDHVCRTCRTVKNMIRELNKPVLPTHKITRKIRHRFKSVYK